MRSGDHRDRVMNHAARLLSSSLLLVPASAAAGEQIVMLAGEVEAGPPDHVFVEFEVPAGTLELEVRHDDLSEANILDWGLYDPSGFRGWGGGNPDPAIVGVDAASRSYLPGPIAPGTWRVVIGKAKIEEAPATYQLEIVLRTAPTLAPQLERTAYAPVAPLSTQPRWYAGDFHVHSRESGDARPDLDEIATFARSRGLDFVEISDHNVLTQNDFIGAAQGGHPELLLIPGMEFTTYAGHANAIGATTWVDHKIGQPDVTIAGAVAGFRDQGALVSLNHPALDLGTFCIGCAWDHEIDATTIHGIEIATTGLDQAGALFDDQAIEIWDDLCDAGAHLAALGGSDDHRAGVDLGTFQSPIGDPTTMVYARELSVAGILEGIRNSRTVVKLQGPDDPMVVFEPQRAAIGDTVWSDTPVGYLVTVDHGEGYTLHVVRDGIADDGVGVVGDPFATSFEVTSPADRETRSRVELHDEAGRRVVTSHVWQRACSAETCSEPPDTTSGAEADTTEANTTNVSGPPDSEGSAGEDTTSSPASQSSPASGCGCGTTRQRSTPVSAAMVALALLGRARRRRARTV